MLNSTSALEISPNFMSFNGWINVYKPRGISSAKVVHMIKKSFKKQKVGHAGTLDIEAEGILPIAVGEATKLVQFLVDARKTYIFTIKFGSKTDTGDSSGQIIETTNFIPNKQSAAAICSNFIGEIAQSPNPFSAIKVNGIRSYKLAREGKAITLAKRNINIYKLELIYFDEVNNTATYIAECSKGTYIRNLAEDIAFSLQSLGFVLELKRIKVGIFSEDNSIKLINSQQFIISDKIFKENFIRIEEILHHIIVLEASEEQAKKIKYGQKCSFPGIADTQLIWVRYQGVLLAIGSLKEDFFNSLRVFNLI